MAQSGTVITWKKPYGLAETADGDIVYIHTSEIDGGRLRVGLEVKFDVEDGKEGKPKGVNVSGEAILAKGQELSDEEIAADKERVKAQREVASKRNAKELEEVWALVQKVSRKNKGIILNKLMKSLNVSKADEKRVDPTQKAAKGKNIHKYSRGEFIAFYGKAQGLKLWDQAGGKTAKKGAKKELKPKNITTE